jgi:hypothetical protein
MNIIKDDLYSTTRVPEAPKVQTQTRKENKYVMDEKKPKVLLAPCAATWTSRGINLEITIN